MKFIILILLYFVSCKGQDLSENELKQQLQKHGIEKNWSESKKVAQFLLDNFKSSDERETYYNVLTLSIINECLRIRKLNEQPPDTTQLRGTITLYISEKLTPEVKVLYNEAINVINKYFKEYPEGRFEDSFYSYLIAAYELQGQHKEVQRICNKIYHSNKPNLKLKAAFHLSRIAHFQKKYKKAIEYYKYILENMNNSKQKILFYYLLANCYYELNDLKNTKKYINIVFNLTEKDKDNDVRKMAKIMNNYLNNKNDKKKRSFVVLLDPANEK